MLGRKTNARNARQKLPARSRLWTNQTVDYALTVDRQINVWKIKHENTAWHSNVDDDDDFDIPDMDDLRGASHDAYLMNQRITSETFRYKFLNYNRSWLVNQLPSMLTPRTLKRSRPYLLNQFSRILNQLNRDISSDSEDDSPDFGPVALTATSRKLIRWWLAKARKQVRHMALTYVSLLSRGISCGVPRALVPPTMPCV